MNHIYAGTFVSPEKDKLRGIISSWFMKGQGNFLDFFGNGDMVRHLFLEKKVNPERIHCVEKDRVRARQMKRFPEVNRYVGDVRDYAGIAAEKGVTFRAAWLDYCGPIGQEAMDDTVAVLPLLDVGGSLILTLMAAREKSCQMQGHEMREQLFPIYVFDAASNAGYHIELRFKAFYSGKDARSTMLVLGFKRVKGATDALGKALLLPSVLDAEERDGLRVVGAL